MRRVTQCAPIRVDNYATDWVRDIPEALVGGSNTSVKFYEFGKSSEGCDAAKKANQTADTTFCVSDYQKETYRRAYTVRSNTVYQNNQEVSDFVPVPDFQVANADVTLMSIFNKAVYAGNNSDALFKAETPVPNRPEGFPARFTASNDLAVLGCTEQYEFCNAGTQKCTGLAGVYAIKAALDSNVLGLNPRQNATSNLMWKGTWAMALQWAAEILSDDLLLARDWVFTTQSTQSSALPDNQWQLEAANLHNLSLATFQRRINDYASPESFQIRPDANSLDDIQPETDRYMRALCGAQKIRSNDHYSVSVLGMLIILCVGSAIILLDLSLEHIFFFRTVGFAPLSKKHDWENTGVLQLHRLVLETRGVGPWGGDPANPVLEDQHRKFEGGVALKQGWGSGSGYAASGREMMESQGSGGTAYQGGVQYSAVPNPQVQGETHLFWDKK
ncbi:hypothetical protein BDV95DRAFT_496063 [Massariosphaeria phaeospora]|uniref:Uncharacterized protein n=1 Tax=Massariosphaeria phaeospora TaxID=100035 RepID=A0A7C8M7D2_9PLEO|nr:hypothetical protein BDV95DRAFT_496063 [Massariosphaeria phaeospora]